MQFDSIKSAPQDALYVCPTTGSVSFLKAVARSLGRADLRLVAPYQLVGFVGQPIPGLAVDDACQFDREQWTLIEELSCQVSSQVSDSRRYQ